jgi:hypothetical protein
MSGDVKASTPAGGHVAESIDRATHELPAIPIRQTFPDEAQEGRVARSDGAAPSLCSPEKALGGASSEDTRKLAHRLLFAVANLHDRSELWGDMRRDSESFERAVLFVLTGKYESARVALADDIRRIAFELRAVAERLSFEHREHLAANAILAFNGLLHDIAEAVRPRACGVSGCPGVDGEGCVHTSGALR